MPTQVYEGHMVDKEYVIHNDNSIRFDTQGRTDGYYCGMQLGWLPEAKESILGTLGELLQSSNEEAYAALSAEDVQQTTSLLSRGDFWLEQNHEACSVMCLSANWVVGVNLLMAGSEGTIVKEGMINGLSATWVDCVIHGKIRIRWNRRISQRIICCCMTRISCASSFCGAIRSKSAKNRRKSLRRADRYPCACAEPRLPLDRRRRMSAAMQGHRIWSLSS